MNFYDFKIENIDNKEIDFSKYKGYVVLIVNVASKCGYTVQYEDLELLYKKYKNKNFAILGFPCRQFAFEEFIDEKKIKDFCSIKYNVSFEIFHLTKVKGREISPIYNFLINETNKKNVKWNFEKFLIDKNGKVVKRFLSNVKPIEIEEYIIQEINKK